MTRFVKLLVDLPSSSGTQSEIPINPDSVSSVLPYLEGSEIRMVDGSVWTTSLTVEEVMSRLDPKYPLLTEDAPD